MEKEESCPRKMLTGWNCFLVIPAAGLPRNKSSKFDGNFKADWTLPQGITSRLWMTGNEGRSIYRMNAPSTTLVDGLTPDDCGKTPNHTPVLLVRQIGSNAKSRPFMSVYESFKNSRPAVIGVRALLSGNFFSWYRSGRCG